LVGGNDVSEPHSNQEPSEAALDGALRIVLRAPTLPPGFRSRLEARMAESAAHAAAIRQELERDHRRRMAELRAEFVHLRRRTLASLLAVAFVAGAALTFLMPWLVQTFGDEAIYVGPMMLGLGAGAAGLWAMGRRVQIRLLEP
jgi:hypothetical protein